MAGTSRHTLRGGSSALPAGPSRGTLLVLKVPSFDPAIEQDYLFAAGKARRKQPDFVTLLAKQYLHCGGQRCSALGPTTTCPWLERSLGRGLFDPATEQADSFATQAAPRLVMAV